MAGAALLAGFAPPALAGDPGGDAAPGGGDVALAIPRLSLDGGEVALPQPLQPSDAARIRRILSLQAHGAIAAAERETAALDMQNPLAEAMLGVILADRYLGPYTRPDVPTLAAWLGRWPDLPDASAIYALLLSRLPHGAAAPPLPLPTTLADAAPPRAPVPEEVPAAQRRLVRNQELDRDVAAAARARGAAGVRRLLARTSGLDAGYAAQLAGEAARALFTANRDQEAYDVAAEGVHACRRWPVTGGGAARCRTASLAGYMAGLAAWRLGRPGQAGPMFEAAWHAELSTAALRAAAAFWAARARLAGPDPGSYLPWLQRAAGEHDTFYGLLAGRLLQIRAGMAPGERQFAAAREADETLGEADVEAVGGSVQGHLAFALLQIGQAGRAEAELRRLWPQVAGTPPLARAVMLVAERAGLSDLAAELADLLQAADGRPREVTRFRVPHLVPDGGFRIDPALLLALARTESNFDATEVSAAGALGIMQIMPETAGFIVGGPHRRVLREARLRAMLQDPEANMALGQDYVRYLSGHVAVAGDLIRLLASYNCGPARFMQWSAAIRDGGDPLLFLEAIPIDETRAFVPRVLAYTWLYAARLHLATPSLDELAGGDWPRYHPLRAARLH